MAAHAQTPGAATGARPSARLAEPGYQAFLLLRAVFTVAPILVGIDKFADVLVDWEIYLAPWIDDIVPGSAQDAMYLVGAIEILAGLTVAVLPRWRAASGCYDVAMRDFGLLVGALALWRLSVQYEDAQPG